MLQNFVAHLLVVSLLSVDSHIIRWTSMCHVKPSQKCVGHPGWHRKHPDGKQHPATKYPGCLPTAKKVCADDPGCVGVWGGNTGCVRMRCHGVEVGHNNCVYLRPSTKGAAGDSSMPSNDLVALAKSVAIFEGGGKVVPGTRRVHVLNHTMRRDENAVEPCCRSSRLLYERTDCSASAIAARAHTLVLIQHPTQGLGSAAARLRGLILLVTLAACGFNVTMVYSEDPVAQTLTSAGLVNARGGVTALSLKSGTAPLVNQFNGMPSWTSGVLGQKERLLERFRAFGLGRLTPTNVPAPSGGWGSATRADLTPLPFPLVLKFPARDGHSQGVRMTHNHTELARGISEMRKWAATQRSTEAQVDQLLGGLVVQEAILGKDEITINFSARDGVLLAAFCLRYNHPNAAAGLPVRFRDKVSKTIVKCDRRYLLPALVQIVRNTSYTGVGCMDTKFDDAGRPRILEMNPRMCAGMYGSKICIPGEKCDDTFCGTIELIGSLVGGCRVRGHCEVYRRPERAAKLMPRRSKRHGTEKKEGEK